MDNESTKSMLTPDVSSKVSAVVDSFFAIDHADLDFNRFGSARLEKELMPIIEAINSIINYNMRSTEDILSNYYKLSDDEVGSKTIVISKAANVLLSKTSDSLIKRRLLSSNKIKSLYITKQNINFIDLSYTDKSGNVLFTGVNYQSAKKTINLIKLLSVRYRNYKHYSKLSEILQESGILSSDITWMTSICESAAYKRYCEVRRNPSFNIITSNSYVQFLSAENTGEKRLSETEIIRLLMVDKTSMNPSRAINSILNYSQKIFTELNINSKPFQYKYTNPVSGFVSIRTKRVLFEGSKITESELEKLAEKVSETNKFFESLASEMKLEEMRFAKRNETDIKLVSGHEIVSYYNISSYLNNQYHYEAQKSNSFDFGSSVVGGPLFNSCMRGPACKNKIKFYSENNHIVKLLALTAGNGKLLKARAVVWYDEDNGNHYVDRIFYSDENSLLAMVSYINKTEGFFSIYNGNNGSVALSKRKNEFLVKFKGLKYVSDTPYFDSVSNQLYVINDEFYFGKYSAESLGSTTTQVKDKVYYSPISFSSTISVPNIESKISLINTRCSRCSNPISDSKGVVIDGSTYCSKHISITNNNIPIVNRSGILYSPVKSDDVFVSNVIKVGGIQKSNFFRRDDTAELAFSSDRDVRVCTAAVTSLANISDTFSPRYSSMAKTVMVTDVEAKKEASDIKMKKFLYTSTGGMLEYKTLDSINAGDSIIRRNANFVYVNYDKESVKELQLSSMKDRVILIPSKLESSQINQIKDISKFAMLAYSRDNKIKINNIESILKLNISIGYLCESNLEQARKELNKVETATYINFSYLGRTSKGNVNGVDKILINTRTSNFSLYIPVDYIESKEPSINKAIDELDALLKKEVSNG